jgi:lipopolysaccharide transport system permease protein
VAYPLEGTGLFRRIVDLNPVTPLLVVTRDLATGVPVTHWDSFFLVGGVSLFMVVLGWFIFRVSMPYVIERLSQ